jgi:hypothetical protein
VSGPSTAWLFKTDGSGNEIWSKTFGEPWMSARSVLQTKNGNYVSAGWTYDLGMGSDAWLFKTDGLGTEEWVKTFDGAAQVMAYSVQQTKDGGFILAGMINPWTGPTTAGATDAWLLKTDGLGNKEWSKTFDETTFEWIYSVQQTNDDGFILAGVTNVTNSDAWLIKTDSIGNEEWSKTFGETGDTLAYSVQQTKDGGFILAGMINFEILTGAGSAWLFKTEGLGNEEWSKTFGITGDNRALSVQQTKDGGFVLAGSNAWIIKTDGLGNEEWEKTFGGPSDCAYAVQQTKDGGFVLAGWMYNSETGYTDAMLIKTCGDKQ